MEAFSNRDSDRIRQLLRRMKNRQSQQNERVLLLLVLIGADLDIDAGDAHHDSRGTTQQRYRSARSIEFRCQSQAEALFDKCVSV